MAGSVYRVTDSIKRQYISEFGTGFEGMLFKIVREQQRLHRTKWTRWGDLNETKANRHQCWEWRITGNGKATVHRSRTHARLTLDQLLVYQWRLFGNNLGYVCGGVQEDRDRRQTSGIWEPIQWITEEVSLNLNGCEMKKKKKGLRNRRPTPRGRAN